MGGAARIVAALAALVVVVLAAGASRAEAPGDAPEAAARLDVLVINLNLSRGAVPAVDRLSEVLSRLAPGARVEVAHFLDLDEAALKARAPRSVVLSPQSEPWWTYDAGDLGRLTGLIRGLDVPVLGVCGGHQLLAMAYGGEVAPIRDKAEGESYAGMFKEKGTISIRVERADPLLAGIEVGAHRSVHAWHTEEIKRLPPGFVLLATGRVSRFQMIRHADRPLYGVQFHPESSRATDPVNERILLNFLRIALGS